MGKWDLLQLHSPPSTLRWVVHSEETEGDVNLREPRSLGHYFKYNPALICYKPIKCSNFNHKLKVTSNPISPKTKWRILKTHETRCLVLFCPSQRKTWGESRASEFPTRSIVIRSSRRWPRRATATRATRWPGRRSLRSRWDHLRTAGLRYAEDQWMVFMMVFMLLNGK